MEHRSPPVFITQEDVASTPMSTWYEYTLYCDHKVLTKTRLSFRASFNQHFIRCPQCKDVATEWQPVASMEAVSDEYVRNVLDGSRFIVPRRILRTDGDNSRSGTPFPYISAGSDI